MTAPKNTAGSRLTSVDALRGAIMVIMALDHVREFFHASAPLFQPDDLTKTTPLLFFTRWITHFCAPTFVFTAGIGAFMRLQHKGSKTEMSRFLVTRGLWLIFIELSIMRLAMNFTPSNGYPFLLLTLWALGTSMMALAALVYLPTPLVAAVGIGLVVLHNTLDGVRASSFGEFASFWNLLHQRGVVTAFGVPFVVGYPILSWIGVMLCGFGFGSVLLLAPRTRQRACATAGAIVTALFVVVRAANVYGDPSAWSAQATPIFTALSFLRTTKNPPSLDFVLMTLGPALLLLALFDRMNVGVDNPLVTLGRVPLFYYVVHFWLIHLVSSAMSFVQYGEGSLTFLFSPLPSMFGDAKLFPKDFGYPLWVTYLVWPVIVAAMYPLCRKFAGYKATHRQWWLSYM